MPATTTHFALPYPLGTDPISDGDDQIKALAEKLDGTTLWPTWTAFPFAAGWSNKAGGYQACEYTKVAGWLYMRGVALYTSGGSTTIGTLPTGFRPASHAIFGSACWNGAATVAQTLVLNNLGTLISSAAVAANMEVTLNLAPVWIG